ncbi:MAG TPA: hypothetical protein VFV52_08395 [Bacilli bacterium]|nr:hypothetical protein [Bacilli bacterium]
MIAPKLKSPQMWWVIVWVLLGSGIFGLSAAAQDWKPPQLFSLLHELTGTTDEVFQNTKALQEQVTSVETKLGQLEEQEKIVARQQETGERLGQELQRQVDLTATGVSLMGDILEGEKRSVETTGRLTAQVEALTADVGRSAQLLQGLTGPLEESNRQSTRLNGQLDQLIRELETSRETFQVFGKLKDILQDPLHNLPNLPLPNLPSLPGLPTLPGTSDNTGDGSLPDVPLIPDSGGDTGDGSLPSLPLFPNSDSNAGTDTGDNGTSGSSTSSDSDDETDEDDTSTLPELPPLLPGNLLTGGDE